MSKIQVRHSTEVEIPETAATRLLAQMLGLSAQEADRSAPKIGTDAEGLSFRPFSAEEFCRWFRVDPSALGRPKTSTAPRVGQVWPGQGGIHAGIMRGQGGMRDYHLIVPTDSVAYVKSVAWGSTGRSVEGTKCEWDGAANTLALCQDDRAYPAADWAYGLEIDGHNDFYLPSRRELRLMWTNVPELFEPGWYWSSTQYSADNAWIQYFGDGDQSIVDKGDEYRARAVRRLII